MEVLALILFLVFYHLKPQEWIPIIVILRPVQIAMAIGLLGLFFREKALRAKDIFRTPHDWLMLFYIGWICFVASSEPFQELKDHMVHIVTYIVTVHALTSIPRMHKLFAWWAIILMTVAALAVLSTMGFDPLGSAELTEFHMKGRLVLNLSIYNNPNTLAHTIVPVVPMLFFLLFWKRFFAKAVIAILGLPLYCIFLTQSKGAFISCFSTVLAILTFGRPKVVQIVIIATACSVGIGALYMLPRMTELNRSKGDAAIQGRVAALKFGLKSMDSSLTGIGPGLFLPKFTKANGYGKAAHNGYNQNGAELGRPGLWLFLALIYACGRTLSSAKTSTVGEERVRRMLFTMLAAYVVSCWMVDFAYRTTFFVLVGATAAFHRIISGIRDEIEESITAEQNQESAPVWTRKLEVAPQLPAAVLEPQLAVPLLAPGSLPPQKTLVAHPSRRFIMPSSQKMTPPEQAEPSDDDVTGVRSLKWRRFGLIDIAGTFVALKLVERFWVYLIHRM